MARALKTYREKRDFKKTAEPKGRKGRAKGNSFVVQKHDATRLHYDFRLELDGVLLSWAVTRGPSLDPADKRLAVRTEDHPLDYGTFEGTIPKGEYGGGTVMLWDTGTWQPLEDPRKGLEDGKLKFRLYGERMTGAWALVRMRPKKGEKRENWLLIKEKDDAADARRNLTKDGLKSIKTGRSMAEIAKDAPAKKDGGKAKKKPGGTPPKFVAPQLATLVDEVPEGGGWLFETKFDGYRCLIAVAEDTVVCYTRSGKDWSERFSQLIAPVRALNIKSALIDGEVTAADDTGKASFGALQNAMNNYAPLTYFAFDLLEQDGESLRNEPLKKRKQRLEELLASAPKNGAIRYTEHVEGHGKDVFEHHCKAGYEGIIAKKADAAYRSKRTKTWLKIKCTKRQEFVIGGWTPSEKRAGFASLLLGYYDGGDFIYAGRVGTGFDEDMLKELGAKLEAIERKTSAFKKVPRDIERGARWVTPKLVAEIDFTEFTGEGHLRHPAFIGLRTDKDAKKIVRETPKGAASK